MMSETNMLLREVVELLREGNSSRVSHVPINMGHTGHDAPRKKTASDKVIAYLAEHPEERDLTRRELAQRIGVGKSTVDRVLNDNKERE